MGKASRNKNHKVNKLTPPPQIKNEEIPTISTIAPPSPIYHPLTQKKEKVKEVLDCKYKELEESKPILEVLENYTTYRKKLDEVLIGRARLNSDDYGEEVEMRIMAHGLPKKICDPSNFVLLVKVNGTIEINALADTRASVSVFPYCLYMNLGLGDPKPYNSNLTMADNTQAKAIGEVKNVRIQIRYQAYLVDFLILNIPMDKELPLLLGHLFLRTFGAVIDMGRGTLCIDSGVIRHTYFPKPRAKAYLDNFAQEEEDDWLSCFESDRLRCSTTRLGEDETPADQLKGCVGRLEKAAQGSHPNLLIENFKKMNKHGTIEYHLQQVKNVNLKWRELPSAERHAYCERLSKLQGKGFGIPRVEVFVDYSWERALSIYRDLYPEWCLEFFSTMYFDRGVDRNTLITKKCIWFRLCGVEKVLILPDFVVLLGLYEEDELNHRLFAIHFTKLEVDDKLFNHEAFWQKIGQLTSTNPRTSLIKEPLMRIVHKLLVGSLVHRFGSKERCQKRDMWMMNTLEESQGINLAWVIAKNLFKHAPSLKENILICEGHYVTKIAHSLGHLNDEEVAKYSMIMRNNYMLEHSMPILHHLADQSNSAYPAYEPPNVPPYPYSYVPYPYPYMHYPDMGSPSFRGDHYGAHGNSYHTGSIAPSSGYEIGGSSAGFHGNDFDPIVHSKDCVESDDDEMRD
uniref:Reverse transcriptase domain-containing protein n=1 Tax=Tanacetum cinerariifolium TaxID=118510 RepID=A0A6L2P4K2_TANCI|nr:hypothetical protein [Tanacetum cinerariifolium]